MSSNKKILEIQKDPKGRILKEIIEGYDFDEGSFRRTTFFDTLGREIKIYEIKNNSKIVQTYKYSDTSTYELKYYDLGPTEDYLDTNFIIQYKDIQFIRHVRLNNKGQIIYECTKWFPDSTNCLEPGPG